MAYTPEVVAELNRLLDKVTRDGDLGDGVVDEGVTAFVGILPYRQRLVSHPDQPLSFGITVQPTLALRIKGRGDIPVPYPKDIEDLGEPLATRVLNFLRTLEVGEKI